MFKYRLLILTFLVSFLSFGQANNEQLLFSNEQLDVSSKLSRCHKPENGTDINYHYLSFTNLSLHTIKVRFRVEKFYGDVCYGCIALDEHIITVILLPGETIQGGCDSKSKSLRIFEKMNDGMSDKVLSNFNFIVESTQIIK